MMTMMTTATTTTATTATTNKRFCMPAFVKYAFVRLFLVALLASSPSLSSSSTAAVAAAAEVIVLNESNFEHLTQASTGQTTGRWFVKFYAPWCGHCKKLAPIWQSLADKLQEEYPSQGILLADVDVTQNFELGERFAIRGYPTLILFADRRMYRHRGSRDLESLVTFVAEGGYKETESEKVPELPSLMEVYGEKMRGLVKSYDVTRVMAEDFEHILRFRKNAALILVLVGLFLGLNVGLVLGFWLGRNAGGSRAKKDESKAKKE